MLLNDVLHKEPVEIRKWVENAVHQPELATFAWLTLAEAAAHRATSVTSPERMDRVFDWARTAQLIHCHLSHTSKEADRRYHHLALINLRVALILKMGACPNNPLLDPSELAQFVLNNLYAIPANVRDLARNWQEQPVEILQKLRFIKNQITPLRLLVDERILEPSAKLEEWLNLWQTLP